MSDYNGMLKLLNTKMPTAILKYPTGKYGICGSIPIELTEERNSSYETIRVSKIFNSEEDVIKALVSVGYETFQLSDCSWYNIAA